MSRRAVVKAGAWAVPVIASAIAVPAVQTSPDTETAAVVRVDAVDGNRAFIIESAIPGTPLPAGVYVFTTTGGVIPGPEVFRTEPSLATAMDVTQTGTSTAVALAEGHTVTAFSAYILAAALPADVDRSATLTVTLPTGGGATIPLFDVISTPAPAGRFGPSGAHWPARTPRPDDVFDEVIEVAPTWSAIAKAIADGTTRNPAGKVKVAVSPGVLPAGKGSGSTDAGAIADVGASGRAWRVLVVPRDGWGTVTATGSLGSTRDGVAFVGIAGVSFMGFDFGGQEVLVRNSQDAAWGWSTFGRLHITANRSEVRDIEFVDCVLPDVVNHDSDRMAFRVAEGHSIAGVSMRGCYVAPTYKEAGSGSHCDTLQTSRSSGDGSISDLAFVDSVFFQSSSQVLQFAETHGVLFDGTAVIGGRRGTGRYPIGAGRHQIAAENALWGDADAVTLRDSVIMGSIRSAWGFTSVTDTVVSNSSSAQPPAGTVYVDTWKDPAVPLPDAWFAENCPMPTRSLLAQLWSDLAA